MKAIDIRTNPAMIAGDNICVSLSTNALKVAYDGFMDSLTDPHLRDGMSADAIALTNVNLSLGSGAARVHILKDISLSVASGTAVGLIGPSEIGRAHV